MTRHFDFIDRRDFLDAATVTGLGVSGLVTATGPAGTRGRCDVFVHPTAASADATTIQSGVDQSRHRRATPSASVPAPIASRSSSTRTSR